MPILNFQRSSQITAKFAFYSIVSGRFVQTGFLPEFVHLNSWLLLKAVVAAFKKGRFFLVQNLRMSEGRFVSTNAFIVNIKEQNRWSPSL